MKGDVLSFNYAIKKGFEPASYSFDPVNIPVGQFDAFLDFKTWSKRILAIECYFSTLPVMIKIVLPVYCNKRTGLYTVKGSVLDFAEAPTGEVYRLKTALKKPGKIILLSAILLVP